MLLKYICTFLLMITIPLLFSSLSCLHEPDHTTEIELEKTFRAHQEEFENLMKMSESDERLIRIAPDFTWLEDNLSWPRPMSELGISEDRWNQYRLLFKKLGLKAGLAKPSSEPGIILFIASTQGLVTGGSSKGYAYSRNELPTVNHSLDNIIPPVPKPQRYYRRLNDRWYLYYEFS